ncbi:MAG: hypothetical protein A2Y75_02670 [Candidatus Solincola sediminis]|uniref:GIY-YIG domain-containing protein n=1 Tax=Candidatus Solincola sediminis TaxID=1797199 RepID=A0A1F2WJP3_9ACTN|nr:MAG: hypothetical protein A2Y75_02670 [Candidatus Solincola sediminis]
MKKEFYVYIMTNIHNKVLYTGVTNNLERRIREHQEALQKGFTKKYNIKKLVYYEEYDSIEDAIIREKQIKGGSRKKKEALINSCNPGWYDLSVYF